MNNTSSPLEYLASFAITFAAGMVATVALGAGFKWMRGNAHMANHKN